MSLRINWGHPLAKDLVFYSLAGKAPYLRDLTGRSVNDRTNATWGTVKVNGIWGPTRYFATTDYQQFTVPSETISGGSAMYIGTLSQEPSPSADILCCLGSDDGSTTTLETMPGLGFRTGSANNRIVFNYGNGASNAYIFYDYPSDPDNTVIHHVVGSAYSNVIALNLKLWVDGIRRRDGSGGGTDQSDPLVDKVTIGAGRVGTGYTSSQDFQVVAFWRGPLTDAQALALYEDPYAFLEEGEVRTYVFQDSGGAPTVGPGEIWPTITL